MSFQSQGYSTFPGALNGAALATLQTTCDALLAEPVDDGGGDRHKIGLGAARRFLAHRHGEFPDLEALITGPTLAKIVEACLGTPGYLFNEQFVVKGAGKGASFAWHQDSYYVGFDHPAYLTVWMALDDATEDNGCVYILPRDLDAQPGIDPHVWLEDSNEYNGYEGDEPGTPMLAKAGDIVAFSSRTLHRSGPNITDKPRRAFIAQYTVVPLIDPATGDPKRFAKKLHG